MTFDFEKIRKGVQEVLSGEVFTRDWVQRQYGLIALIFVMFAVYINCGYTAQRKQHRIAELNRELEDAHFEYLTVSAQLVEQTRQSVILKQLEENGSKVKMSNRPAVQIED